MAEAGAPVTPAAADPKAVAAVPAKADEATETIKVDGKEIKLTRAQLVAAAQKGLFADKKLEGVKVLQGKTQALIEALKTPDGLLSVLRDPSLGASPKEVFRKLMSSDVIDDDLKEEMSKWVYDNVVVQAKKTPEEVARDKKLNDYERLKAAEDKRKKDELTANQNAEVNRIYQGIRAEVTKQIVADKGFPQTEGSIRSVVEKLRVMNKKGAPVTVETIGKAISLVKNDNLLHQQSMFDVIEDPEALIAYFGEARALKISKALVARLQAKSKVKPLDAKPDEEGREKVTERIDKKLGRTQHGYHVLNV